jgi:hypothetical protein
MRRYWVEAQELWSADDHGVTWHGRPAPPQMVAHYVEGHGYRPPEEFVQAVLACPAQGSPEYASAIAHANRPLQPDGRVGRRAPSRGRR